MIKIRKIAILGVLFILITCHKNQLSKIESDYIAYDQFKKLSKPFKPRLLVKNKKIKSGETILSILSGYLPDSTIFKLYRESREKGFSLHKIRSGNSYNIFIDGNGFNTFEYEINKFNYYSIEKNKSSYYASVKSYSFETDTIFSEILIRDNLYSTMQEFNLPMQLAFKLSEIFAWDLDFSYELYDDDKIRFYYERLFVDGRYIGTGKVIAAEYKGLYNTYSAVRFEYPDSNRSEYYSFDKKRIKKTFLKAPVNYSFISSGYTKRRFHPIQKRYKSHFGIDFVAKAGTPVFAIADGTIKVKRFHKYNGNYVHIKHNGNYDSKYLHLSRFAANMYPGTKVRQGEVIGYVGSTGLATGDHVCFRFYRNGKPYNIQKIKNPVTPGLDLKYFDYFEKNLSRFDRFFNSSDIINNVIATEPR